MNCGSGIRKDGKNVCFKWVEDTKDTEDTEDIEDMEEGKTSGINPKAICSHCCYVDSCMDVLRGLEIMECSTYRETQEEQDWRRSIWKGR